MTETILVVDDEDSVRRTFREWLEGAALGCRLLMAEDAASALRQANEHAIDLAILDWNLGAGNDGLQLLEDLQVFHPDVVAIMITGFADQATPVQAMRMGVRDYLDKNQDLNRNTFLRAVRHQLDRIRPARRERAIQQNLREFHDTLEKVLPLIQTTTTLQETTPFAEMARSLLQALQVSTQAQSAYLILVAENEPIRGSDQHGNTFDLPPLRGGYALSQLALTFQGAVVLPDLPIQAKQENIELFPHQQGCRTMLAVPLTVNSHFRAVLELFDPLDGNGNPTSFRGEDRRLVSALVPLAEDLLRQSVMERQTRVMLLNAIQTALQSTRTLADSLESEARPEDPLSPAILDTIRQGLSDSPDAAQMVRLAEGIRILSMRFGPAAIRHCIHLVESLRGLLETTSGSGGAFNVSDRSRALLDWLTGIDLAALLRDPRASGAGVRVAVVDTGIDLSLLPQEMASRVIGQVRLVADRFEPQVSAGPPGSPHGTTVAHIILSLAPEVELYSIDVFGSRGVCEVEVLIRALRLAVETANCRVINLSLGIQEGQLVQVPRRTAFLRMVEEAYFRNVMVIAAASNDHPLSRSYPAAFGAPVFGVARHEGTEVRDIRYQPQERIEFQGPGTGRIGPLASIAANSWATPHVSGVIAQFLSLHPELTTFEMKTLLARISAGRP